MLKSIIFIFFFTFVIKIFSFFYRKCFFQKKKRVHSLVTIMIVTKILNKKINKMKKLFFYVFILSIYITNTYAQQKGPHISFEKTTHDFGTIYEEDSNVSVKFIFKNTGTEPVVIQNVHASCGCTTPDWSKMPVNPGKEGFIEATYSPKGTTGAFSKTVSVSTNAELQPIVLRIKGEVAKKEDDLAKNYPVDFVKFKGEAESISFGQIKNTEQKIKYLNIYNSSEVAIKIEGNDLPSHISVQTIPQVIEPKGKGKLSVTYNTPKKNAWDYNMDVIMLKVNGNLIEKTIRISATITEDFTKMSEKDLAKAPKITFKEKTFDFGKIKQGEKVEFEFEFTNEGKNDLIIRKTHASCGCTAINMSEKEIKSGKTGSIKAVFSSVGKSGIQNKTITIITNDPQNEKIILWIKGEVE